MMAGVYLARPLTQNPWVIGLVVVLIAPNVLRTFCLHFIASNMHYYGDHVLASSTSNAK
jgi:hypothetical protein